MKNPTSPLVLPPAAERLTAQWQLGLAIGLFLAAATVPYSWLIAHFGYDDILREPAADILRKFHDGGAPLVLAWFSFAMAALLFIPVALGFDRLFAVAQAGPSRALVLGVVSAVAQATGLLRWVLVVPALATAWVDPQTDPAARQAVLVVFDAVHRYGGMVIGEMLGQLLLAGWTLLVACQLWRTRLLPRWLAALGLLTLPFWLVGQSELLHMVVPALPSVEVVPLAFMAWEAWLAAVAVALIVSAVRLRAARSL